MNGQQLLIHYCLGMAGHCINDMDKVLAYTAIARAAARGDHQKAYDLMYANEDLSSKYTETYYNQWRNETNNFKSLEG